MKLEEGKVYIRIKPVVYPNGNKDYSYCTDKCKFLGRTDEGRLIIKLMDCCNGRALFDMPITISTCFDDDGWILYKDLVHQKRSSLSNKKGKMATRIKPTDTDDKSYMGEQVKIMLATKYHIIIRTPFGVRILDCRYTDPDDWKIL